MIDEISKTDLISGRMEQMEIPCHNRHQFATFRDVLMNLVFVNYEKLLREIGNFNSADVFIVMFSSETEMKEVTF